MHKDKERIQALSPRVVANFNHPYRNDMNNVDIESEILQMEENKLRFNLAAKLLKKRLTKWRDIFKEVKN